MADCKFCGDPAAHPATGCAYGPRTLACHACVVGFWAWMTAHTKKKAARRKRRDGTEKPATAMSFYEAAGKR